MPDYIKLLIDKWANGKIDNDKLCRLSDKFNSWKGVLNQKEADSKISK
jgi:hypothetical protein